MREFKVNEYITLRLENNKTNIYVKGELFEQCKYILTRKKIYDLKNVLKLESVDELTDRLGHSLEEITPDSLGTLF